LFGEYLSGSWDIGLDHYGSIGIDTGGRLESKGKVKTCRRTCPIYVMPGWKCYKDNVEKMGRIETSFEVVERQGNKNWL